MSATATAPAGGTTSGPSTGHTQVRNVTFARVLRSEWIKLWTLRSTWWTLASTVVVMIGFALLLALVVQLAGDAMEGASPEDQAAMGGVLGGTTVVAAGYEMAALVVAVLGALMITGEYSTGMIRSTFAAVPGRLPAFFGKALVLVLVTAVLTAVSLALSWLVTYPILNANDATVDFGDGDQVRSLFGTVLYVSLVALFALGLGTLLRHTAGAIFTVVAIFLVIPTIFQIATFAAAQLEWVGTVNKLLPSVAGAQITPNAGQFTDVLDPWVGIAVLGGYTALVLIGAAARLKAQDA
ncbi:ABC transporter permease [Promicromonospora thailandica]|uniref:ABC-2 type transport system permease protein n=1 Tax=Promicromonospora thailandica TaxID=765201 RepID=A0A9X2G9L9_9MICO|nr:ABC transporter permease [Promicromonospora thailandica]MCP2264486.1 ABC-2 type transport system permease protein [Promicromonospora thailandica]BFF20453.1 ABC transporter permease subunit [Promicromonospora thailandica]